MDTSRCRRVRTAGRREVDICTDMWLEEGMVTGRCDVVRNGGSGCSERSGSQSQESGA